MLMCHILFPCLILGVSASIVDDSTKGIARDKFDFIRIKVHYLQDNAVLTKLTRSPRILLIMKDALAKAVDIIQSTVKVERLLMPLLIKRPCKTINERQYVKIDIETNRYRKWCEKGCFENVTCWGVQLPDSHLDDCYIHCKEPSGMKHGVGLNNTDLVVYVMAIRQEDEGQIALASPCSLEPIAKDRPTSGLLQLSTNVLRHKIRITTLHGYHTYISTMVHELIHILGHAFIVVPFFRNSETGQPLTPRSGRFPYLPKLGTLLNLTNYSIFEGLNYFYKPSPDLLIINLANGSKWKGVHVVKAARSYFNCTKLSNVVLFGKTGHSHANYFVGDTMSPVMDEVVQPPGRISQLTAAFLEDTGWYRIKKSRINVWQGKTPLLGCKFAKTGCKDYDGFPCCFEDSNSIKCSPEGFSKSICLALHAYSKQYVYRLVYLHESMKATLWKYTAPFCRYPGWKPKDENNVLWEFPDKDSGFCFRYARVRPNLERPTKLDKSKLPLNMAAWQQKHFDGNQQLSGCYKVNCNVPNGYNVSAAFGPPQFCREAGRDLITFKYDGKKIGPFLCYSKAYICASRKWPQYKLPA